MATETVLTTISLGLALVAAAVAVWQGTMARDQLRMARTTRSETERLLNDIRDVSRDTKSQVDGIKRDIDSRITQILDLRIEKERADAQQQARMLDGFVSGAGKLWQAAMEAKPATPDAIDEQAPDKGTPPADNPDSTPSA